jgi:hypothetical protein
MTDTEDFDLLEFPYYRLFNENLDDLTEAIEEILCRFETTSGQGQN